MSPSPRLLEEIPTFPARHRKILETEYGIDSAEAFFAHAVDDPEGMGDALKASPAEIERLTKLIEGYVSPEFAERCRHPSSRHPRGLSIDPS
jgi:hypothetical protein